jgi:hypothetical protein
MSRPSRYSVVLHTLSLHHATAFVDHIQTPAIIVDEMAGFPVIRYFDDRTTL